MRLFQINFGLHFDHPAGGAGKFFGKIAFRIDMVDIYRAGGTQFDPEIVEYVNQPSQPPRLRLFLR